MSSSASTITASTSSSSPPPKPRDPDLAHLTTSSYENVYEPSEDSFLLMDALYEDLIVQGVEKTLEKCEAPWCMEIGPGSGIILTYLSLLLSHRGYYLAIDINPLAARATRETMRRNGVRRGDVVVGDLIQSVKERMRGKVDILIFNPPYVPTPPEELLGDGISRSWAGGIKGREILDKLLPDIQYLLSEKGVFYCVLLSSNVPQEVEQILQENGGFEAHLVLRRKAGIEDLSIVRYRRPQQNASATSSSSSSSSSNSSAQAN